MIRQFHFLLEGGLDAIRRWVPAVHYRNRRLCAGRVHSENEPDHQDSRADRSQYPQVLRPSPLSGESHHFVPATGPGGLFRQVVSEPSPTRGFRFPCMPRGKPPLAHEGCIRLNTFAAPLAILAYLLGWGATQDGIRAREASTYSGTWTATVGESRTLRGRWIGEAIPQEPLSAHGSWTLAGPSGKTALTGTWAAHKTAKGWQGTWSATTGAGRAAAGTWKAALPSSPRASLQEFMELLLNQAISGTWRSGRLSGSWWLESSKRPAAR